MQNIPENHTYSIKDISRRGFILDISGGRIRENENVIGYYEHRGYTWQQWRFKKSNLGGYTIHTTADDNFVLGKYMFDKPWLVIQAFDANATHQVWSINSDMQLMNLHGG